MAKSSSDSSTKTTTSYSTTTSTNIGLTGTELAGILGGLEHFALASQESYLSHFSTVPTTPDTGTAKQPGTTGGGVASYIPWLIAGGALVLLFLAR